MTVVKRIGLIVLSSFILTSCASNGDQTYLKSRNGPDLVVPAPLTKSNMGYFYNLPLQNQDARVSIEPPTLS